MKSADATGPESSGLWPENEQRAKLKLNQKIKSKKNKTKTSGYMERFPFFPSAGPHKTPDSLLHLNKYFVLKCSLDLI